MTGILILCVWTVSGGDARAFSEGKGSSLGYALNGKGAHDPGNALPMHAPFYHRLHHRVVRPLRNGHDTDDDDDDDAPKLSLAARSAQPSHPRPSLQQSARNPEEFFTASCSKYQMKSNSFVRDNNHYAKKRNGPQLNKIFIFFYSSNL